MPEDTQPTKKQTTKKQETKKQDKQKDKLEELIDKLEERLAIFNESEMKKIFQQKLVEMNETIQTLYDQHQKLYELLGLTYGDINYPK